MSNAARIAPAPIYEDPEYNSARDACLVYNRQERCWWIVYPAARVGTDEPGFSFTHGNDIRAASTPDRGLTWRYRGPLWGIPFERGRNTYTPTSPTSAAFMRTSQASATSSTTPAAT